jgi:hypothetical protein
MVQVLRALIVLLLALNVLSEPRRALAADDQELYRLARTDLKAFAQTVSANANSELGQAQAIVRWLAQNFEWTATDYENRSVAEIIERKGGNCNELAMVAQSAMQALNIKLRQVHEVNIHLEDPERGVTAHEMVSAKGNAYSIFGRHHNDHIWLELYDSVAGAWLPADPSSGLVGVDEWMQGRIGFGERVSLNPITNDMIVPFAIFAADANGQFTINRTQHYLVQEFDALYAGKLHTYPAWKEWTAMLDQLDDKVEQAFAGETNLHDYEMQIDSVAATYERLRAFFQGSIN